MIENSFEHAMSIEGPELLRLELKQCADPEQYIEQLGQTFIHKHRRIMSVVTDAAMIVEPEDKVLGADQEGPKAFAFTHGAILGIRVADVFMPRHIKDNMHRTSTARAAKYTYNEQTHEEHAAQGELLMDISGSGLAYAESYQTLLEELEEDIVPEVINQRFFRNGFGFVMSMMHDAWEAYLEADRLALQEKLDHPETYIDWDTGLKDLLGDG